MCAYVWVAELSVEGIGGAAMALGVGAENVAMGIEASIVHPQVAQHLKHSN